MMQKQGKFYLLGALLLLFDFFVVTWIFSFDFVKQLSDLNWVLLSVVIRFAMGCFALWILWQYGDREIFRIKFKKSYLAYFILLFVLDIGWNIFCILSFPIANNQVDSLALNASYDKISLLLSDVETILIAPFTEELIYRGLVMSMLTKFRKYKLDIIGSSILFSLAHIIIQGFIFTDFLIYLVPGLIYAVYFRKTNCIYYTMAFHIFWNSLPFILKIFNL